MSVAVSVTWTWEIYQLFVPVVPDCVSVVVGGVESAEVNDAEALSAGTGKIGCVASRPSAITVFVLEYVEGTLNVQENAPLDEVVCEVQSCVDGITPLKVKLLICMLTVNLEPVTVTTVPSPPLEGLSVIVGVVTVNASDLITAPVSGSLTTTRPIDDPFAVTNGTGGPGMFPDTSVVNWFEEEQGVGLVVSAS